MDRTNGIVEQFDTWYYQEDRPSCFKPSPESVTDEGLKELKQRRSSSWNRTRLVDLSGAAALTKEGLAYLPNQIKSIGLAQTSIDPDDLSELYAYEQLEGLSLSKTSLKRSDLAALPLSITHIDLSYTPLSGGLTDLSAQIVHLDLSHTDIRGLPDALVLQFEALHYLNLSHTLIDDRSLYYLPPTLHALDLGYTRITDKGLRLLPSSLRILNVQGCPRVTEFGLGDVPGSIGKRHAADMQAHLKSMKTTKGFSWRITKPGHPTHYLVGVVHYMATNMIENAGVQEAVKSSKAYYTEPGLLSATETAYYLGDPKRKGWDTALEIELSAKASRDTSPIYALDHPALDAIVQAHIDRLDLDPTITKGELNFGVHVWNTGDITALETHEAATQHETLCRYRNGEWMKALKPALLRSRVSIGIFPGAAHVVGPEGLKQAIEGLGFQLTRI